jgi:hypothetical protein
MRIRAARVARITHREEIQMDTANRGLARFVNPLGQVVPRQLALAKRLNTLSGKRVGLINTGKPSIEHFLGEIEQMLRADYSDVQICNVRKDFTSAKPIAHQLEDKVDAAISAWGD